MRLPLTIVNEDTLGLWKEELGRGSFGRVFRVTSDGLVLAARHMTNGGEERTIAERRLRTLLR